MKLIRIVTLFAMVCLAAGQDAAPGSQITVQGLAIRGHAQFEPMPDFTVGISPTSLTVVQGGTATATVTITSINGFHSAVNLVASTYRKNKNPFHNQSGVSPGGRHAQTRRRRDH
jgi:hypothetical protein